MFYQLFGKILFIFDFQPLKILAESNLLPDPSFIVENRIIFIASKDDDKRTKHKIIKHIEKKSITILIYKLNTKTVKKKLS